MTHNNTMSNKFTVKSQATYRESVLFCCGLTVTLLLIVLLCVIDLPTDHLAFKYSYRFATGS